MHLSLRRASFVLAGAVVALSTWSLRQSRAAEPAPATEVVFALPSLEEFLSATYGEWWSSARAQLLAQGMVDEARLAAPFDASTLRPWSMMHEDLGDTLFGSGFDEAGLRSMLGGWHQPSLEENLARYGLGDDGRPFSDDERARIADIVAQHADLLDELADAASEELKALVREMWVRNELLRVPSVETPAEEDAPPLAVCRGEGQPLTYRTLIAQGGWTILIAPDLSRSQALVDILEELSVRRDERFREIQSFLLARS